MADDKQEFLGFPTPARERQEKTSRIRELLAEKEVQWGEASVLFAEMADIYMKKSDQALELSETAKGDTYAAAGAIAHFVLHNASRTADALESIARVGADVAQIQQHLVKVEKRLEEIQAGLK